MKHLLKLIALSASLIIVGCASTEQKPIIIAPDALASKVELMSVKEIAVVDERKVKALGIINGKSLPTNSLMVPSVKDWLTKSFTINPYGSKQLEVALVDYASHVKQETMTFNIESVLNWRVKLTDKNGSWVKSYQSTINEEGPLTADNAIIEKHLNGLATKLLEKTLEDDEFKQALYQ